MKRFAAPVIGKLLVVSWGQTTSTDVVCVGETPRKFAIRALKRTRLGGRNRWLEPGQETLVPKSAVLFGPHSVVVHEETDE